MDMYALQTSANQIVVVRWDERKDEVHCTNFGLIS